jgi:hypothetical protein
MDSDNNSMNGEDMLQKDNNAPVEKKFDRTQDFRMIQKGLFSDLLDSENLANVQPVGENLNDDDDLSENILEVRDPKLFHLKMPSSLRVIPQRFDPETWRIEEPVSFITEVSISCHVCLL